MRCRGWLLVLWFLVPAASVAAIPGVVVVDEETRREPLAGSLAVLPESAASPGGPRALLADRSGFIPHPGIPAWGFNTRPQWLTFTLHSALEREATWWLEVRPVFTDHIDLYWVDETGTLEEQRGGDLLRMAERPMDLPAQVFPLTLAPGETRPLLLRVQGTNPLFVDAVVWHPTAFAESWQWRTTFMAGYMAILGFIVVAGLLYTTLVKDRLYFFYALYALTLLAFQAAHTGYFDWLVEPRWTRLADLLTSAFIVLSLPLFVLIFIRITLLRADYPRLGAAILGGTAVVSVVGLAFVAVDRYVLVTDWIQLYILLMTGFAVVFSVWRLRQGQYREGSVYFGIFGALAAGVIARILRDQGLLPNNFFSEYGIQIGTVVHLLLMQLFIIWRLNNHKRMVREELEGQVALRTGELIRRNRQLDEEVKTNRRLQERLRDTVARARTAYEAERRIRREQEDFFRMVSHEFRTPLTVIDGSVRLLDLKKDSAPEERATWLEQIRGAAKRLVSLVDSSLWESRLDDVGWRPSRETVRLRPWLGQLTENLGRMYPEQPLELDVPDDPVVVTDPDIIKMVLQNLVDNAVRFSPGGTPVTIAVEARQGGVGIAVRDFGPGVPEEIRPSVFNRYVRMAHAGVREGLGIGLYLSQRAARRLGGELSHTPAAPGACFILLLPDTEEES